MTFDAPTGFPWPASQNLIIAAKGPHSRKDRQLPQKEQAADKITLPVGRAGWSGTGWAQEEGQRWSCLHWHIHNTITQWIESVNGLDRPLGPPKLPFVLGPPNALSCIIQNNAVLLPSLLDPKAYLGSSQRHHCCLFQRSNPNMLQAVLQGTSPVQAARGIGSEFDTMPSGHRC
uniref:Uncharacterized protein n=1 Tax=Eutreptiella gymnastica TaxID=73025 RepID=A0A7S1IR86_9EUGL|mmetsp:Transcript_37176/g.66339  ORF Transcript_37176/g.66339 Transcript_37176/m.66339 type:complete len:174 (+) Transcript_37176:862-1383(+)